MPEISPILTFHGNCVEAMHFYESALHGKLEVMMTNAQSPVASQAPPGSADRIMHARLVCDGGTLMAMDDQPNADYKGMNGFSVSLVYGNAAEAKRAFEALAKGGKVTMPMDKTFWAEAFGMLTDRFGTPWMVNGAMTPI